MKIRLIPLAVWLISIGAGIVIAGLILTITLPTIAHAPVMVGWVTAVLGLLVALTGLAIRFIRPPKQR